MNHHCTRCHQDKPESEFRPEKSKHKCRACENKERMDRKKKTKPMEPRPCPCGGTISPHEGEKPYKFLQRQFCCNTCPKLAEKKADGSRTIAARAHKEAKDARTPATNRNPVDMFIMGKL